MAKLAIRGGSSLRTQRFPTWPIYDEREIKALEEVIKSGRWGRHPGGKVEQFEKKFAELHDAPYAIAVATGTAAIETALRTLEIGPGAEVIVPNYTFIGTASPIVFVGAHPVIVDIDRSNLNIDPGAFEAAITTRTKAVIPVHIGGRPADMDRIIQIAKRNSIAVIEDACQAPGSQWREKKVGTIGDMGAVSFQSSKNINAGEGGMILTDNQRLAELAWSYHNCGRKMGGDWYQHELLGGNLRMTEFAAAVLIVQLERFHQQTERRRRNAKHLDELLAEIDGVEPLEPDPRVTSNAYHLYIFIYHAQEFKGVPKKRFIEALNAEGIPASPGYVHGLNELIPQATDSGCPVAERVIREEAVWLKQNVLLAGEKDMRDVAEAVVKIRDNLDELAQSS